MLDHLNSSPTLPDRVVILGAKGFVGSAAAFNLESVGVPTLALGRQELDLTSENAAADLAALLRPNDSLLMISAQAPVKDNKMLESNICMMSAVCEAIDAVCPAHIVYVSSDAVYADSPEPLSESSCAQPDSLHGVMHLAREVMLKNAYTGPLGFIRPTLIYGARDPHNGYGPNCFRRLAEAGQEIVLFGEGEERRDHVYIDDIADLVVRMLMFKSSGVLNAATGTVTSFREIAEMVVALVDTPVAIKETDRSGPMPHNGYRAFDVSAIRKAFPDVKLTSLAEGIAATQMQNNVLKN